MNRHKHLPDELVLRRHSEAPATPEQSGGRRSATQDQRAERPEADLPDALTFRTSTTP